VCVRRFYGAKKKILGKRHDSYFESMAMLERIYEENGDEMAVEACLSLS
jgi:hypothetical protein